MDIEKMFTNYIRTTSATQNIKREAEQSDTRLGINRHDPDEERRRERERKEKKDGFTQDDFTGVSIASLQAFLVAFIEDIHEEPEKGEDAYEIFEEEKEHELEDNVNQPQTPQAAQAHAAYSNAASAYSHNAHSNDVKNAEAVAKNLGLSSDEVRTIYSVIEDLKVLQDKGLEYLSIERGDSFLQSIVSAVTQAKLTL